MAFGVRVNSQQSSDKQKVDWEGLNKYIVETCGLQNDEVLTGIISGLYDLGIQEQEDAKVEFKGTEEDELAEIAKSGDVYFETSMDYDTKQMKRYKRWPQKPVQSVAFAIDFPDILLDKGPFFGAESSPKPLRLLLGGEFVLTGGTKIVARPQPIVIRKNDKTNNKWSFMPNSTIYKLAVGTKVINAGDAFTGDMLDQLLGKAAQFKARVFFNKDGFYNEKCAFAAGLARNMSAPAFDDSLIHIVQFDADNKEEDLKQLRISVRNTMARAQDYAGSKLEAQLNKLFPNSRANTSQNTTGSSQSDDKANAVPQAPAKAKISTKAPKESVENPIDLDDDVPF